MAEVIITKQNFQSEVLESDVPVLLDFWASWCGPCIMLAPIMSEIAEAYEGKAKVGKVNVDECPELAAQYGISSIPTVLLFKEGKLCGTSVGLRPKFFFEEMLK